MPASPTAVPEAILGAGSGTSFVTSQGFGAANALEELPSGGVLISGEIRTNPTITSVAPIVPGGNQELEFPGAPGSVTESGHRNIPVNMGTELHGSIISTVVAQATNTTDTRVR